ncbi:protein-tyrosine phosphatase-like protein [Achaetomium macrosporum]|uniref:Protein-tyrosine phosphatase-like protein n=1 Tax=Achaetomium macrosporum TaxID=79813 RepID=A0AAN7CLF3_9PEZI|nr:protein-tyrosine phosphatase-like protein [Achaetomium macrosporum]
MAHLPRFHRRKKNVAPPTLITNDLPDKTASPPSDPQSGSSVRSFQKLSPFRVFHRSSGKRARDSPPASHPHSPAAAPVLAGDDRPVSPLSLKTDPASDDHHKVAKPQKIPAFLNQTEEEIENKFSELVWRERNRLMQSINNPSPDFQWARVTGPHLKVLDRYLNIQPWHNNRIKLQVPEGHVDYINASPIVLTPSSYPGADGRPREPDRYIAMQGPKQTSVDHVWRMVVEQLESPGVIVMLTETHEGHMEKCFPYFPRSADDPPIEINERDEFSDGFRATVRCEGMEDTPAGDAIELRKLVIRVHSRPKPGTKIEPATGRANTPDPTEADEKDPDLDIKMKSPVANPPAARSSDTFEETSSSITTTTAASNDNTTTTTEQQQEQKQPEERIVWHFLYKKWPDFGVPSLEDLESFFTLMRLSREKNAHPNNPRIVHCSAGVGRSGTFIALEHLIRELDAGVLEDYDERAAAAAASLIPPPTPSPTTNNGGEEGTGNGAWAGTGNTVEGGETPISPSASGTPVLRAPGQGEDLVFETVNQLREQRRTMVQAESQYQFIYQVMRKLWIDRYGDGGTNAGEADGEDGEADVREPAAKRLEVDPFVE